MAITHIPPEQLFIDGDFVASESDELLESVNPSTGEVVFRIPNAGAKDVQRAVEAAQRAGGKWASTSWLQRGKALDAFADALEENLDELAEMDALEGGNPVSAMRDDVNGAVREIRMFAGFGSELKGSTVTNGPSQFAYTLAEPYGVVGRIIPYNHPLKFAAGKIAAPLMAGNTIVLKPSEHTSMSALRMAAIAADLFPAGTINVVTGCGETAGAAIAEHGDIPRVGFTGSVRAGRAVLRAAAEHIKHVTLELGGKNPMIVFGDVDVAAAAKAGISSMNLARCQGQSCQSTSRIFVHDSVYDEFAEAYVAAARKLKVGDALDEDVDMGPVAFADHYDRVRGYIESGEREGAELLTGGLSDSDRGYFVEPTVFGDVDGSMTIAREEIFGPVVSLFRWSDYEQMIAEANAVDYGLTASIWTNDINVAHRTAHRIQSGYVWINGRGKRVPGTPFGGYKYSGLGKESSIEELHEYTQVKVVSVDLHQ